MLCCLMKRCSWIFVGMILCYKLSGSSLKLWRNQKQKLVHECPCQQKMVQEQPLGRRKLPEKQQQQVQSPPKVACTWRKKLLIVFVLFGVITSIWLFFHLNERDFLWRKETLANMCDERARMLQDQFNVSLNHVHALAILVSTFHHGKHPSAIDQVCPIPTLRSFLGYWIMLSQIINHIIEYFLTHFSRIQIALIVICE